MFMPINAKPEYFIAVGKYNEAKTIREKLTALEEMLRTAPDHKGSEGLRAEIKQKLAKLRASLEKERQQQKKKGTNLTIKKEGSAQVVLVAMTNSGKSSLLKKLTNANPTIGSYGYTTKKPEVGIMEYKEIKIQIVELPAIYEGFAYKGMGPTYFSIIRNSDLIVFLIDLTQDVAKQMRLLKSEFEKAQIKLNASRPPIEIKKTGQGGLEFSGKQFMKFDMKDANKLLKENNFHNATIIIYGPTTIEQFAEALNESITYLPCLIVYNKVDLNEDFKGKGISSITGEGIEAFKYDIWNSLGLMKIYTKQPGKSKDTPPLTLKMGSAIKDLAAVIHKDFYKKFNFARVWGKSVKHQGNRVGLEHILQDEDIVEFHLK